MALVNLFVQHLGSMLSVIAEARDSGVSKLPSATGIALDSMAVCLPCAGERRGGLGSGTFHFLPLQVQATVGIYLFIIL